MINSFTMLASSDSGPVVHVAPNVLFTIGGWPITNSILLGWICAVVICLIMVWAVRRVTIHPRGGVIQYIEAGVEFATNFVEGAFTEKEVAQKYIPFFVTMFFFILLNNWSGLIPGVGEGITYNGNPLLRPMTADLNATLAMGVITMGVVYIGSVRESGGFSRYMRHFFAGSLLNPGYLFIGIIEIITDLTRVISLSLRLFLNVAIGEMVIAVFVYLGQLVVPIVGAPIAALPFTLLEFGVALLQAYIFAILGISYLAMAANTAANHDADHSLTEELLPETMGANAQSSGTVT